MENEKLEWAESHKSEILYLYKNRNNPELCKIYSYEMKQINSMIAELNREFRQRIKEFIEYIRKDEKFRECNRVISNSYGHSDKNNISKLIERMKADGNADLVTDMGRKKSYL